MTDREKFESICNLTTNIVGLQKGSLSDKTRNETIHVPRMVASVVGRLVNDIHPTIIADVICRDRTSVLHYYKLHTHNYASFPKYREVFNKVYYAYSELKKSKKVFKSKDDMRMFIIKSGVKVTLIKPQVHIIIKSKNIIFKVKTDYLHCSENIIILKDALKDYEYSLEIKTI
tara:strand:- start:1903 stop:2421 length:519 start_codon:yes stop_codon:yes gene_type:complete